MLKLTLVIFGIFFALVSSISDDFNDDYREYDDDVVPSETFDFGFLNYNDDKDDDDFTVGRRSITGKIECGYKTSSVKTREVHFVTKEGTFACEEKVYNIQGKLLGDDLKIYKCQSCRNIKNGIHVPVQDEIVDMPYYCRKDLQHKYYTKHHLITFAGCKFNRYLQKFIFEKYDDQFI